MKPLRQSHTSTSDERLMLVCQRLTLCFHPCECKQLSQPPPQPKPPLTRMKWSFQQGHKANAHLGTLTHGRKYFCLLWQDVWQTKDNVKNHDFGLWPVQTHSHGRTCARACTSWNSCGTHWEAWKCLLRSWASCSLTELSFRHTHTERERDQSR